jgi:hypothetical protein
MGLVDYSESESSGSEKEAPRKSTSKPAQPGKKPAFQKVVDRANPGKILVNLPQSKGEQPETRGDEPPAKRARTGGGGLFSGFSSFLPPPKNPAKPGGAIAGGSSSRAVFSLKTGAAPGFSRDVGGNGESKTEESSPGLKLPPPRAQPQPEIPADMKPEEEVELVGKPLMFRPLSVARKPAKKAGANLSGMKPTPGPATTKQPQAETSKDPVSKTKEAPPPKKISLFSISSEQDNETVSNPSSAAYEPLFTDNIPDEAAYQHIREATSSARSVVQNESLDAVANDLNLSAAERRELFGRQQKGHSSLSAAKVINFNMDQEYKHNEELRSTGEQQVHNPVRAIAGGKHSLKQLVNQVQTQRDALEESFAKGRNNRMESSGRYGW